MRSLRLLSLFAAVPSACFALALTEGSALAQPATPAGTTTATPNDPTTPQALPPGDKPKPEAGSATGSAAAGVGVSASPTASSDKPKDEPKIPEIAGTAGAHAAGTPVLSPSGNFMDTRLTWTFGDDDFLHKTGELIPLSPTFSIGERQQYRLFFDNLNSRFTGRENLTHLVMYKKLPAFIDKLTTEASLVMRFDLAALSSNNGNLNGAFYDSGSYLRLFYQTGKKEQEGISATFFPLDTDRVRLGYLYDISWGGTASAINQSIFPKSQGATPGLKVQYDMDGFYAYLAFKTATIIQPQQVLRGGENDVDTIRVGETNYGILAGAGVDFTKQFRLDAGAGYFQQGRFDLTDVRGRPVYTYGSSARLIVHDNMPVPRSIDFQLYRNDPNKAMVIFAPEKYTAGELAWSVSAEGSVLGQHLKDFDTAGALKDQFAMAGAVQGVLKAGYLRFSATGIYRNLNFVVRNVPGFIPFNTLPKDIETDPELFGAVTADYHFPDLHLTPGIGGGLQLPSTFKSTFKNGSIDASRTVVLRQQGDESILPYNKDRTPILQARASLKWDVSAMLSTVIWAQYVRDNNGTLVVRDQSDGSASLRTFQSPDRFGVGTAIQARF
jgi:hypothetical protein